MISWKKILINHSRMYNFKVMTSGFDNKTKRNRRFPKLNANNDGFTLIEMLVVIAIIASITGLVGPRVLNYLAESKVKTAQIQMSNLSNTLDLFYLDVGRYPTSDEGLNALVKRPSGISTWNGPYISSTTIPKDPWGHDYLYRAPGQNGPFDVGSLGPPENKNSSKDNFYGNKSFR